MCISAPPFIIIIIELEWEYNLLFFTQQSFPPPTLLCISHMSSSPLPCLPEEKDGEELFEVYNDQIYTSKLEDMEENNTIHHVHRFPHSSSNREEKILYIRSTWKRLIHGFLFYNEEVEHLVQADFSSRWESKWLESPKEEKDVTEWEIDYVAHHLTPTHDKRKSHYILSVDIQKSWNRVCDAVLLGFGIHLKTIKVSLMWEKTFTLNTVQWLQKGKEGVQLTSEQWREWEKWWIEGQKAMFVKMRDHKTKVETKMSSPCSTPRVASRSHSSSVSSCRSPKHFQFPTSASSPRKTDSEPVNWNRSSSIAAQVLTMQLPSSSSK